MIGCVRYVGMNVGKQLVHVLWECISIKLLPWENYVHILKQSVGEEFVEFSILNHFNFILLCENWDLKLKLVKSFVLLVWDTSWNKLYSDQDGAPLIVLAVVLCLEIFTSSACVCRCVVNGASTIYGSNNMSMLLLVEYY